MTKMAYLIGEPGVGKTTVAKALFRLRGSEEPDFKCSEPFKYELRKQLMALGHYNRAFGGTDTFPPNTIPAVRKNLCDLVSSFSVKCVFGEGDKLANQIFFQWAETRFDFRLFVLAAPPSLLVARRLERGSNQEASWLEGKRTKLERLMAHHEHFVIDARANPNDCATVIDSWLVKE